MIRAGEWLQEENEDKFGFTIFGFFLYMFVLSRWTASRTAYGFGLVPLVTIVVAASIGGEQITWKFLAGAALVLAGVVVGVLLPGKAKPAVAAYQDSPGEVGSGWPVWLILISFYGP